MKKNKQKNSGTDSFPIDEDGNVWVVWGQPELYRLKLSNLKKIANSDWTEDEDGKQIRHKIVDNHGKTHMMTKSEAYFHIIDIPKKIIKLTESDLSRIVKRVIKEQAAIGFGYGNTPIPKDKPNSPQTSGEDGAVKASTDVSKLSLCGEGPNLFGAVLKRGNSWVVNQNNSKGPFCRLT